MKAPAARRCRRELLRQAVFAAAAAAVPLPAAAHGQASVEKAAALLFANIEDAHRVGAAYQRVYGDEPQIRQLQNRLFGRAGALGPAELAGWIEDRREADLARGDVVVVAGWLLARSEARLCAAIAAAAAR